MSRPKTKDHQMSLIRGRPLWHTPHIWFNSLRPRQNRRHFADDTFKCIFLNENAWTSLKVSLKFVPKGPINIIPALVQIMGWRRLGDKPLSEPMMVSLPTHICVTRPQCVKQLPRSYWHINYGPQLASEICDHPGIRHSFRCQWESMGCRSRAYHTASAV